jgi:hypothetical protein
MDAPILVYSFSRRQKYLLFELLRGMTAAQRFSLSWYMTKWEIEHSRAEIAKDHPEYGTQEVKLKWVEVTYGEQLAKALRAELNRRAELGEYPLKQDDVIPLIEIESQED